MGCGSTDEVRLAVIFWAVALSDAVEEDAPYEPLKVVTDLDFVLPVAVESLLPAMLLERRLVEPFRLVVATLEETVIVEV